MAKIFLSHSSKDKDFVRKLARNLKHLGHNPWYDEWEIRVGECIVSRIQEGLSKADFVILVLTPEAVASGWVKREWKDAYWSEIKEKNIVVLPVLLRKTDIPKLLRTKKYADFSTSFEIGFGELCQSLPPSKSSQSTPSKDQERKTVLTEESSEMPTRILERIKDVHISKKITESIQAVLSHPQYPQWMSVSGKLMRNPIWASISDDRRETLIKAHRLTGPSPPNIMHLDMHLIRRKGTEGRGELYTYYSRDWDTNLIRFRQWLPEDDPNQRSELNTKKMAKHCDGNVKLVSVTPLQDKFAVSVKPHPRYEDLIIYVFEFCSVEFSSAPDFIRYPEPNANLWSSLDAMRSDQSSWKVNADVIRALHELFTVSLAPLPISYSKD